MYTPQLGLRLQSSLHLLSSWTSKLTSRRFSPPIFRLGAAMVTFVLGIAAAEEHAVVVQGEALGVEEGDEVAVVVVAAERPACCQIGVPCPDDIVAVSLTGQVFHEASFRS